MGPVAGVDAMLVAIAAEKPVNDPVSLSLVGFGPLDDDHVGTVP
jgi:hypothetical protein